MCGIVASIGRREDDVAAGVAASRHRGPDSAGVTPVGNVVLGHARLAILDLNSRSDQPFKFGRTTVAYNGEVWNFREIRADLQRVHGLAFSTEGDTEVVAAVLDTFGWLGLKMLNGMFAIAWTTDGSGELWLARDRFGEIPLHVSVSSGVAASELKALIAAGGTDARFVNPGYALKLQTGHALAVEPNVFDFNVPPPVYEGTFDDAVNDVRRALCNGVRERTIADVRVCTLLSGGLDSTAVAWAAAQVMPDIVSYTAVHDKNSADLRHAREAARDIGIELREVYVPAPTPEDLTRTVEAIEMPHKAQVEIAWACLVLARTIREDGFKVVFSGEGSDELWGSYGFAYHGIEAEGWHGYRRRLFMDQHRKNFARCNKAFMTAGVECRLPFLHPPLVDLAWSLPKSCVVRNRRPKAVLEEGFADVLNPKILKRAKVAFQDGTGLKAAAAQAVAAPAKFYKQAYDDAYGQARSSKLEDVEPDDQPLLF